MSGLLELAARVEAAEGPDRVLDAEVAEAIGYRRVFPRGPCRDPDRRRWVDDRGMGIGWLDGSDHFPPRYTASLDAAMTLVPEGWEWSLEAEETEMVWPVLSPWTHRCQMGHLIDREAATPALALCAAALRARASQEHPHDQ